MGRADEVEALANALRHHEGTEPAAAVIALREYGALLRRSESDVRFGIGEWSERDTRPRFAGGARSQEDEDRCAPLVEFAEKMTDWLFDSRIREKAREALRAHRERSGDGA